MPQVKITVLNGAGQEIFRRVVSGGVVLAEDRSIEVKRVVKDNDDEDRDDPDYDYSDETLEKANKLVILPGREHMIVIEDA